MIKVLEEAIKPVFEDMDILSYLRVSYSDKADFQINSVFAIAKDKGVSPIEIGEELVSKIKSLSNFEDYFKSVEFIKPGFINIFLSDKFINSCLNDFKANGFKKNELDELYMLDYGGPNVAKPLHIGHLRPAIIGESLKRILKFKGYKTIGDVHLGDFGLQIGQVIYGIKKENKSIDEIDIDFLNYIYPKMSALCKEDKVVYEECKKITYDFQHGEYRDLYKKIKEVSVGDIKRLYDYLYVDFDLWLGESDSDPYIPKVIELLENKNLLVLDEGAKVVNVKEDTDNREMPPCMIVSSDGTYMYATTDLATIYNRFHEYNPDHVLYVVDARQGLYFEQVYRVSDKVGLISKDKLEHTAFGTINGSDGKPFKTRSGETLKLDDLISEVKTSFISKREENKNMSEEDIDIIVNAIIKYADLQNNRAKSYNFDIAKFSDVSGKTGPYILYSALRIRKILENNKITNNVITGNINNEIDRSLRFKILEMDKYLDKAVEDRLPSYIAEYVYDLCNTLNTFYQNVNISKLEDEAVKNDYLNVLETAYKVIEACLDMLVIKIPSEM